MERKSNAGFGRTPPDLLLAARMGKGRDKRRRNAKKQGRRTKEEEEIVRALEAEDARISAKYMRKRSGSRPSNDPPNLGEPDAPVRSPLRPRPTPSSAAIALPEPEPEEFSVVMPHRARRGLP